MIRLFAHISRDRSGVTVVETALILPIILVLGFSFAELANAFALQIRLMRAAQTGIEFVAASDPSVPTDSEITAQTTSATGFAASDIALTRILECNGVPQASGSTQCPNSSDVARTFLKITISATYQPLTNVSLIKGIMPSGRYSQSATVQLP